MIGFMKKRIAALLILAMLAMAALAGCEEAEQVAHPSFDSIIKQYSPDDTWAIYWYLCGSDLETEYGAATTDLEEMTSVELPENVFMVIQTGGADYWDNNMVDEDYSERYLYDADGIECIEQNPIANMGDRETLADFLRFCLNEYDADHKAFIFWNHGGGSVSGVIFDEQFDYDSLSLNDISWAFEQTCTPSEDNPVFELVGFDACLMATLDTAYILKDYARYMVASEELEPGLGWNYTGFLSDLAANPGMDGAQLGRSICDSYKYACEEDFQAEDITLSVVDLSKIDRLMDAYNNFGVEALNAAAQDTSFFASYSRAAKSAENYGGNTPDTGYYNMVDLGDLARKTAELLPRHASETIKALEDCVIYQIRGPYRDKASGLSVFHSYNADEENFNKYSQVAVAEPFLYFYEWAIRGDISNKGKEYIANMSYEGTEVNEIGSLTTISNADVDLDDYPVYVNDDGYAVLDLGPEIVEMLSDVYFELIYIDDEGEIMLMLGRDNDIEADWENGIFMDNFRGVWGAIDDNLVYMEISYVGDDYNLYSVPILLNGKEYSLSVSYDFTLEEWEILGARRGIGINGMSNKGLIKLRPGDEITPIFYYVDLTEDDLEEYSFESDTFVYQRDSIFHETDMGDGTFVMMYEMVDVQNNSAFSDLVWITVEDGDIYVETDY